MKLKYGIYLELFINIIDFKPFRRQLCKLKKLKSI